MTLRAAGTKNLNSIGILCVSFLVYSLVNSNLLFCVSQQGKIWLPRALTCKSLFRSRE